MKTESSKRALPLLPEVEKILLEHWEMQEEYRRLYRRDYSKQYLDMVCVDPLGNLIRPNYISERFPKMLKKNGLPRIRFHDLRHSCASMLIAHKAGMKQVQMWMGHSSITTTMDTYDLPMPVWTFLEEYDLSGKTIIPFFSHNGSSSGASSRSTIAKLCPGSTVLTDDYLSVSGRSVSGAGDQVANWVAKLGYAKNQ